LLVGESEPALHRAAPGAAGGLEVVGDECFELGERSELAFDEVDAAVVCGGDVAEGDGALDALGDELAFAFVGFVAGEDLLFAGLGGGAHLLASWVVVALHGDGAMALEAAGRNPSPQGEGP